ncbi:integrase, partial [Burkholderia stabilis]
MADAGWGRCSGLMNPDTDLGENVRHEEVSDEQATTYVFPG